jgi:hypothetical protein
VKNKSGLHSQYFDCSAMNVTVMRLRSYRSWLLLTVIMGLLILAPLDLLTELNSYYQLLAVPSVTAANLHNNLARPDWEYPGELMMAANLAPVANYFGFALKSVGLGIAETQKLKALGTARRLYRVSLVIMLFFIFYHISRTTADADPLAGEGFNFG